MGDADIRADSRADATPAPGELLDAVPDGLLLADAAGIVTHANEMAHRLLVADRLVGRPLADVMRLQDLNGRDWVTVTAPYTGLAIRRLQAEQAWQLSDGTELLVTTRIVRDSPADPVRRVGVSLRSARARRQLDRERSDLVATLAHELRSPLTGVKGFTGTLLAKWDRFSDDQKRLIMQSVHTDTDRLTRLIAELLEVARIDTGRLSLHPRPLDVEQAVRQVTASVRAGTGREIVFEPEDALPQILADPDRFAQVVTNLVENAVQHGDGTVRIGAHRVEGSAAGGPDGGADEGADEGADGAADMVQVVVQDQGDGIAPEIRRRVFTKYWKHGVRGGTGLGMYIVHGLVLAHGGRIAIADAAGGGARIEVLWPVVPPDLVPGGGTGSRPAAAAS